VELSAAIAARKQVVFSCAAVAEVGKNTVRVGRGRRSIARKLLPHGGRARSPGRGAGRRGPGAGRHRGQRGGLDRVNQVVRQALTAGIVAVQANAPAVDAFRCGEPEAPEALGEEEVVGALEAACAAGLEGVVAALLGRGGAAAAAVKDYYPLWIAASNGHVAVVELLLGAGGVKVDKADKGGLTPLYMAAQKGHVAVVELLMGAKGVKVNEADKDGRIPLYIAAQNGHVAVMGLLLGAGADPSVSSPQYGTALQIAERKGHMEVAALFR
jgi:hypothetical protein